MKKLVKYGMYTSISENYYDKRTSLRSLKAKNDRDSKIFLSNKKSNEGKGQKKKKRKEEKRRIE